MDWHNNQQRYPNQNYGGEQGFYGGNQIEGGYHQNFGDSRGRGYVHGRNHGHGTGMQNYGESHSYGMNMNSYGGSHRGHGRAGGMQNFGVNHSYGVPIDRESLSLGYGINQDNRTNYNARGNWDRGRGASQDFRPNKRSWGQNEGNLSYPQRSHQPENKIPRNKYEGRFVYRGDDRAPTSAVLRVIVHQSQSRQSQQQVTLNQLHELFSKHGKILKIVTYFKHGCFQALVQCTDMLVASVIKETLNRHKLSEGCQLQVENSPIKFLTVKGNSEKEWDFTLEPNFKSSTTTEASDPDATSLSSSSPTTATVVASPSLSTEAVVASSSSSPSAVTVAPLSSSATPSPTVVPSSLSVSPSPAKVSLPSSDSTSTPKPLATSHSDTPITDSDPVESLVLDTEYEESTPIGSTISGVKNSHLFVNSPSSDSSNSTNENECWSRPRPTLQPMDELTGEPQVDVNAMEETQADNVDLMEESQGDFDPTKDPQPDDTDPMGESQEDFNPTEDSQVDEADPMGESQDDFDPTEDAQVDDDPTEDAQVDDDPTEELQAEPQKLTKLERNRLNNDKNIKVQRITRGHTALPVNVPTNFKTAQKVVDDLCHANEPIALDVKLINPGKTGRIATVLVQTMRQETILFDVWVHPGYIKAGVKSPLGKLLCNESILKIMHNCKDACVTFYCQAGIKIVNVFDTMIAHHVINTTTESSDGPTTSSEQPDHIELYDLCNKWNTSCSSELQQSQAKFKNRDFIVSRPMTPKYISLAASTVQSLVPTLYETLKLELDDDSARTDLFELMMENQLAVDSQEGLTAGKIPLNQKQRKRQNALKNFQFKIDTALKKGSALKLNKKQMVDLKYITLTPEERERLHVLLYGPNQERDGTPELE